MSFDKEKFLQWLDEDVNGYYVSPDRVKKEWPSFYEHYELIGVTSKYDPKDDTIETPVRDYRQAVKYGHALD